MARGKAKAKADKNAVAMAAAPGDDAADEQKEQEPKIDGDNAAEGKGEGIAPDGASGSAGEPENPPPMDPPTIATPAPPPSLSLKEKVGDYQKRLQGGDDPATVAEQLRQNLNAKELQAAWGLMQSAMKKDPDLKSSYMVPESCLSLGGWGGGGRREDPGRARVRASVPASPPSQSPQ